MSSAWDGTSCGHVDLYVGWNDPWWVNKFVFETITMSPPDGNVYHPHRF
jgi:hypothetical protein